MRHECTPDVPRAWNRLQSPKSTGRSLEWTTRGAQRRRGTDHEPVGESNTDGWNGCRGMLKA
eukprot:52909-Eustigmatos_ZCMA.PRE.1